MNDITQSTNPIRKVSETRYGYIGFFGGIVLALILAGLFGYDFSLSGPATFAVLFASVFYGLQVRIYCVQAYRVHHPELYPDLPEESAGYFKNHDYLTSLLGLVALGFFVYISINGFR